MQSFLDPYRLQHERERKFLLFSDTCGGKVRKGNPSPFHRSRSSSVGSGFFATDDVDDGINRKNGEKFKIPFSGASVPPSVGRR